jgi:hypothetical protein
MANRRLSAQEAIALQASYPMLPREYFAYLSSHGWGKTPSGKMLYSGPVETDEIYGTHVGPAGLLVLGDDFAGYCFAYDPHAGHYGELDPPGQWEPWSKETRFDAYALN